MPLLEAVVLALAAAALVAFITVHWWLRVDVSKRARTRAFPRSSPRRPGAHVERSARAVGRVGDSPRTGEAELRRDASLIGRQLPDDEVLGITRREFFNRGLLGTFALALAGGASTMLAFLWPGSGGGFGGKIPAGDLSNILSYIKTNQAPFYVPEARTYIQPYPKAALPAAKKVYEDFIYANMQQGIVALYQRCTHLGCRVPWCQSSQWFECPCHGSKYNRVGEKRDGPTPRGLDRFEAVIDGGKVTVNTGLLSVGPPIGTNTTGQVADGPHCVG